MAITIEPGISIGNGISIGDFVANLPTYPNGDFSQGLTGWTSTLSQVFWSGGSTVAGWPTPVLPNPLPYPAMQNFSSWTTVPSWSVTLDADKPSGNTGQSVNVESTGGVISPAYGTFYGPALSSNAAVAIAAGTTVAFDWRAVSTTDAYSIYCYLVNTDTGAAVTLLRTTAPNTGFSTAWQTNSTVINVTGTYKWVFVAGCWDATGGLAVCASFRVTNIQVLP